MGKITISGDTLEEVLALADSLRPDGYDIPADAPPVANGEKPKAARTRKKAEAPAPMQPNEAPGANPFTAAAPTPEAASPFPPTEPFAPGAANPERPVVTKLKELLNKLASQHGEPQVYAWCMQKGFGLSPTVTKEEFLTKLLPEMADANIETVYKQGGGA